jgi:hypothetical protein
MKKCSKCQINERFSNYNAYCRSCKSKIDLKSYHNQKENRLKYNKDYKTNNKEKINNWPSSDSLKKKEYMKKWIEDNKKHVQIYNKKQSLIPENIEKRNNRNKERWKNDLNYKIKLSLRNRFRELLKRNKTYKTNSILKLLNCSLDEFKHYIESLFLPEMNWSNWGSIWELDHKEACSKFDLTKLEEQEKCFNYTNLQPLFKTSEIAKSLGYIDIIGNRNKYNK